MISLSINPELPEIAADGAKFVTDQHLAKAG